MPVERKRKNLAYGLNNPLQDLVPSPIVAQRAPTTSDFAQIGQTWINQVSNAVYVLTEISANSANWATSPASGSTTLASLTVNGVSDLQGNTSVGGTLDVTGATTVVDLSISGTFGYSGTGQLSLASSANQADAVKITASNGGIDISASGASAGEDIDIVNTAGSININSGEVDAASMVLTSAGGLDFVVAGTGGLDIDMANAAGSINITASEAAADAIVLHADDAAGGIQLQAGSNGILIGNQADCATIDLGDIVPTSARTITLAGGTVATAIADTLDLGPDGVDTDAGASKVVTINNGGVTLGTLTTNVASGAITSGTHTVNVQTGNAAGGTVATNVSTGTGTKTVNLGNADANTTFNIDAVTLMREPIELSD